MPTWRLEKSFTFEAAHKLPHHDGKCARLHGHSWRGTVALVTKESAELQSEGPKQGMIVDYGDMKGIIKPIVDKYLDHHYLNDTLEIESPTSEEVARWLWNILRSNPVLVAFDIVVIIEETCTSKCSYTERLHRRNLSL